MLCGQMVKGGAAGMTQHQEGSKRCQEQARKRADQHKLDAERDEEQWFEARDGARIKTIGYCGHVTIAKLELLGGQHQMVKVPAWGSTRW